MLESATARIAGTLHDVSDWSVLAPNVAAERLIDTDDREGLIGRLRAALADLPLDINILPAENRKKRLLVADMDSTIITCECLDEIADFAGLKAQVSGITERAMRGELAFEPALRERVGLLKGMPASILEDVYKSRVTLMPGARAIVQTMRRNGAYAQLVSGGFTFFTERVAVAAGFNENRANRLEISGGTLTGTVAEPILGREAKLSALVETAQRLDLPLSDCLAVGDGANDLAMIEAAGLGVAFHAKPLVAEAAAARIDHSDLTGILYLQGYRYDEFAFYV